MERDIIRERTIEGLRAATARGRVGGRPKGLSKAAKLEAKSCKRLFEQDKHSIEQICAIVDVSRSTFYKYLHCMKVKLRTAKTP